MVEKTYIMKAVIRAGIAILISEKLFLGDKYY
jgi:hypothetical protein